MDDYDAAMRNLNDCPEYEVYTFCRAKLNDGETLDMYHTMLKQLAATCKFTDVNKENKSQIIQSGSA